MSILKLALVFALAMVIQSKAQAEPCFFDENVDPEYCPDFKVTTVMGSEYLVCGDRATSDIFAAKADRNTIGPKRFRKETGNIYLSAIDIGVWPDDSSTSIYRFGHNLITSSGAKVGYITIEGFTNSEMEARVQVTTRYNTKGEVAALTCERL